MIWDVLIFLLLVCLVRPYGAWMRRAEKRAFPGHSRPRRSFLLALGFVADASDKPPEGTPAPRRAVRLTCWCVLYIIGAIGCQIYVLLHSNPGARHVDPKVFEIPRLLYGAIVFAITLPCGLGYDYSDLISPVRWIPDAGSIGSMVKPVLTPILIALGFATYLIHFEFTLRAKTLRAFLVLMFALVLLHGLSIAGWTHFMLDVGGKR